LIVTVYLSGALAFLIHLLVVVFGFIVHLPVLASIHAVVLATLAKIHLIISGYILKKTVIRSRRYKKFHAKLINSKIYLFEVALFHKLLKSLGIEKPKKVKVIEMRHCPNCGKEIPLHGRYCTKCGAVLEEKAN
jgi:ribosomal protein L32